MKRYKMQVRKTGFNNQGQLHVCADPAGEYVRFSDVMALADLANGVIDADCYCYEDELDGEKCGTCKFEDAIEAILKSGTDHDTENQANAESSLVREGEAGACET